MKSVFLFLVFFSVLITHAQPPAGKGYVLLFNETFSGNQLNEADWRYRIDRRTGFGYMDGLNRKENVYVKDSALHVRLNHEWIDGKWENTGGGVISNHNFGYGYYECLSKPFMEGHGVHTSFWQRGAKNPNNNIFEIDSYEIDSKTYVATNNLYFDLPLVGKTRRPWPHRAQVPFKFREDGWFLDAYEFTPEGVFFYDNGKLVARADWNQLNAHQNVWLTALNGVGKVDTALQPAESIFKYFRYYGKDYPGITLLPNGNFEYNQELYDQEKPLCWNNEGTPGAIHLVKGDAYSENYKLKIGKNAPYKAAVKQELEYIMNGSYRLTAMVRTSGKAAKAAIQVEDFGGKELFFQIPTSKQWTKVELPLINVTNNHIRIKIVAEGDENDWLEIDQVLFLKPGKGKSSVISAIPFSRPDEPFWSLAEKEPVEFKGDEKFYFFDRNVGYGDTMVLSMELKAGEMANMTPIARIPQKGSSGWSVQLTNEGGVIFRIGSIENHTDVLAPSFYEPGKYVQLSCEFENGTARIFKNGTLMKTQTGILQNTKDATAAGRVGTVGKAFEAVGEVVMQVGASDKESKVMKNFRGCIQHLRIYNGKILE